MDDIIDNLPGASTKKGCSYLDNDIKFEDIGIFGSIDNDNPNPFYLEVKQPENPFDQGPDDFDNLPQRGFDSLDNSFDNVIGQPNKIGINFNFDAIDKPQKSNTMLLETPRSYAMGKDNLSGQSPTNNQLAQLYKVTNKTTTIKQTKPHAPQLMLTEQQIQQFQQQQYSAYIQKLNQQQKYQRQQQQMQNNFSSSVNNQQTQFQNMIQMPQQYQFQQGEMPKYQSQQNQLGAKSNQNQHIPYNQNGYSFQNQTVTSGQNSSSFPQMNYQFNMDQSSQPNYKSNQDGNQQRKYQNSINNVSIQDSKINQPGQIQSKQQIQSNIISSQQTAHFPMATHNQGKFQFNPNLQNGNTTLQDQSVMSNQLQANRKTQVMNNSNSMANISQMSFPLPANQASDKQKPNTKISLSMSPIANNEKQKKIIQNTTQQNQVNGKVDSQSQQKATIQLSSNQPPIINTIPQTHQISEVASSITGGRKLILTIGNNNTQQNQLNNTRQEAKPQSIVQQHKRQVISIDLKNNKNITSGQIAPITQQNEQKKERLNSIIQINKSPSNVTQALQRPQIINFKSFQPTVNTNNNSLSNFNPQMLMQQTIQLKNLQKAELLKQSNENSQKPSQSQLNTAKMNLETQITQNQQNEKDSVSVSISEKNQVKIEPNKSNDSMVNNKSETRSNRSITSKSKIITNANYINQVINSDNIDQDKADEKCTEQFVFSDVSQLSQGNTNSFLSSRAILGKNLKVPEIKDEHIAIPVKVKDIDLPKIQETNSKEKESILNPIQIPKFQEMDVLPTQRKETKISLSLNNKKEQQLPPVNQQQQFIQPMRNMSIASVSQATYADRTPSKSPNILQTNIPSPIKKPSMVIPISLQNQNQNQAQQNLNQPQLQAQNVNFSTYSNNQRHPSITTTLSNHQIMINNIKRAIPTEQQINQITTSLAVQKSFQRAEISSVIRSLVKLQSIMETYTGLEKIPNKLNPGTSSWESHFELKQTLQKEIFSEVTFLKKADETKLFLGQQQIDQLSQILQQHLNVESRYQKLDNGNDSNKKQNQAEQQSFQGQNININNNNNFQQQAHQTNNVQNSQQEKQSYQTNNATQYSRHSRDTINQNNITRIDKSNHQNISIEKFIKQDVIFNFHMGGTEGSQTNLRGESQQNNANQGVPQPNMKQQAQQQQQNQAAQFKAAAIAKMQQEQNQKLQETMASINQESKVTVQPHQPQDQKQNLMRQMSIKSSLSIQAQRDSSYNMSEMMSQNNSHGLFQPIIGFAPNDNPKKEAENFLNLPQQIDQPVQNLNMQQKEVNSRQNDNQVFSYSSSKFFQDNKQEAFQPFKFPEMALQDQSMNKLNTHQNLQMGNGFQDSERMNFPTSNKNIDFVSNQKPQQMQINKSQMMKKDFGQDIKIPDNNVMYPVNISKNPLQDDQMQYKLQMLQQQTNMMMNGDVQFQNIQNLQNPMFKQFTQMMIPNAPMFQQQIPLVDRIQPVQEDVESNVASENSQPTNVLSSPRIDKINKEIEFLETIDQEMLIDQKPDKYFMRTKLEDLIGNNMINLQCQSQLLKVQAQHDFTNNEFNQLEKEFFQELDLNTLMLQKFYVDQQNIQRMMILNVDPQNESKILEMTNNKEYLESMQLSLMQTIKLIELYKEIKFEPNEEKWKTYFQRLHSTLNNQFSKNEQNDQKLSQNQIIQQFNQNNNQINQKKQQKKKSTKKLQFKDPNSLEQESKTIKAARKKTSTRKLDLKVESEVSQSSGQNTKQNNKRAREKDYSFPISPSMISTSNVKAEKPEYQIKWDKMIEEEQYAQKPKNDDASIEDESMSEIEATVSVKKRQSMISLASTKKRKRNQAKESGKLFICEKVQRTENMEKNEVPSKLIEPLQCKQLQTEENELLENTQAQQSIFNKPQQVSSNEQNNQDQNQMISQANMHINIPVVPKFDPLVEFNQKLQQQQPVKEKNSHQLAHIIEWQRKQKEKQASKQSDLNFNQMVNQVNEQKQMQQQTQMILNGQTENLQQIIANQMMQASQNQFDDEIIVVEQNEITSNIADCPSEKISFITVGQNFVYDSDLEEDLSMKDKESKKDQQAKKRGAKALNKQEDKAQKIKGSEPIVKEEGADKKTPRKRASRSKKIPQDKTKQQADRQPQTNRSRKRKNPIQENDMIQTPISSSIIESNVSMDFSKSVSEIVEKNDKSLSNFPGKMGQYNLVACENYQSFNHQQYQIYFSFEVQILMHIHSYLSKNEVIGLLGGSCFDTNQFVPGTRDQIKILVVTKIYPSQSSISIPNVRLKNCEISDEDQIKIQEQMDRDGVQKLAWYHSHPVFDVDPSIQDCQTHFTQQVNFDRQGLPFFGVILGPYYSKQSHDSTLFRVFHLKDDRTCFKPFSRTVKINYQERIKSFHYKIIPISKLKYQMYSVIKQMIKAGASHKYDRPDLLQDWAGGKKNKQKINYCEKLAYSLKKVSEQNLELQSSFDAQKEIKDRLTNENDLYKYEFHINGLDIEDERQIKHQFGEDISKKHLLDQLLQRQSQRNNIYFSISDKKKVRKFLFKIEQCLLKNFNIEESSFLQQILEREDLDKDAPSSPKAEANDF